MTLQPLTGPQALDASFLDARARLLDVAAILDRIDRGGGVDDPRLTKLRAGIAELQTGPGRAERIQTLFSLPYDAGWERPIPR